MHILVSAFAFAPHTGSEPGVGWRWARELARDHQVTVMTDLSRAPKVEAALAAEPVPNLRVVCWRPAWLRSVPLSSRTAHAIYLAWQFGLLGQARALHARQPFDLAMHLTYGVFRHPCFLGYLGIPFVFGPVGGGEDVPWSLKRSLSRRERIKESLRSLANTAARFDPLLWLAMRRAGLILAKTADTRAALAKSWQARTVVCLEIGIDSDPGRLLPLRQPGEPLRVLFAGRLLGWKGVHLALRAVARASAWGVPVHFSVVGSGPCRDELGALAARLALDAGRLTWHPHLPQAELFDLYGRCHCLLFPSLHDSSGNVVLEAQSFGLPVICVDRGGPPTLVTPASAHVVATHGLDEAAVVRGLADALSALAGNEQRRRAMGAAAFDHARRSTWRARIDTFLAIVRDRFALPAARPANY